MIIEISLITLSPTAFSSLSTICFWPFRIARKTTEALSKCIISKLRQQWKIRSFWSPETNLKSSVWYRMLYEVVQADHRTRLANNSSRSAILTPWLGNLWPISAKWSASLSIISTTRWFILVTTTRSRMCYALEQAEALSLIMTFAWSPTQLDWISSPSRKSSPRIMVQRKW